MKQSTFLVHRRVGERLVLYKAALRKSWAQWSGGKPVGLPRVRIELLEEVPWAGHYAGHAAWVGEQIQRVRDAIKRERERRAQRRTTAPTAA